MLSKNDEFLYTIGPVPMLTCTKFEFYQNMAALSWADNCCTEPLVVFVFDGLVVSPGTESLFITWKPKQKPQNVIVWWIVKSTWILHLYIALYCGKLADNYCFDYEGFFWHVVVVGERGEVVFGRKCGSEHFPKDRQMEGLMDRKMKEILWVLSKEIEREMEEREGW